MKKNRGITLVALVVTIVVLLILAGITLVYVLGDNSIFQKALDARTQTEIAKIREHIELIRTNWWIEKQTNPNTDLDDFWDKLIEENIIGGKGDIKGPEKEGENDVYQVETEDGYIVEIIVDPDGNITIGDISKGESLAPKVQSIQVMNKTSNSIEVKVEVSRLEEGKLSYYYKKETEEKYHELAGKQNTTDSTATFTGLESNKVYNIRVVAENKKGNGELTVNVLTGELQTGVISQTGKTIWTNNKASIELETTNTDLTLKYQIGGIEEDKWLPYNGPIGNLNHNDTVYAVLTDGANYGEVATIVIKDATAPIVTVTKGVVTTNSIGITVTATDNEWGMPTSPNYSYYIKKKTDTDYPTTATHTGTETSYIFAGLIQNTDYDIKVTTKDKAVNEGTGTLLNTKTETVGGADEDLTTGNITASSPTWNSTSHTASITLSTTTGLQIQYQKNGISGTWTTVQKGQNSVTISSLNHGDNIYARLWDGMNAGSEAYVTIRDEIAPNAASITVSPTTVNIGTKVTGTVTQTDGESGVDLSQSKWIFNTTSTVLAEDSTAWNSATTFSSENTPEFTPTEKGSYYLHILTVDNGGNKKASKSGVITVNQLVTGITVSQATASIEIGKTQQLTVTITPNEASNKTVTWSSSPTSVATVSNTGLVTGVKAGTATITVTANDGSNKSASCTITVTNPILTSDTMTSDTAGWLKMNEIAKAIANDSSVTSSSTKATGTTASGDKYEINVGDIFKVKYNEVETRVRVLGFKHDDLVNTGIYDENHSKASISFEFYDYMLDTKMQMNSSTTNSGGWANTQMRKDLNGYTTNNGTQSGVIGGLGANLSNKDYIKQVKKKYIPTYNIASTQTSNDYLWLLASSEIVNSGYQANSYGLAITKEGNQYKYYQGVTEVYNVKSTNRVKESVSGESTGWWLRSPYYGDEKQFMFVRYNGAVDLKTGAAAITGVAPGFCI